MEKSMTPRAWLRKRATEYKRENPPASIKCNAHMNRCRDVLITSAQTTPLIDRYVQHLLTLEWPWGIVGKPVRIIMDNLIAGAQSMEDIKEEWQKAVVVDFNNFVAHYLGIDLAMYTSDLED